LKLSWQDLACSLDGSDDSDGADADVESDSVNDATVTVDVVEGTTWSSSPMKKMQRLDF